MPQVENTLSELSLLSARVNDLAIVVNPQNAYHESLLRVAVTYLQQVKSDLEKVPHFEVSPNESAKLQGLSRILGL